MLRSFASSVADRGALLTLFLRLFRFLGACSDGACSGADWVMGLWVSLAALCAATAALVHDNHRCMRTRH